LSAVEREPIRAEVAFAPKRAVRAPANARPKPAAAHPDARVLQPAQASAPDAPPPVAERPIMPDVVGMKLSEARKTLRALGVRVIATDPYGDVVAPDMAHFYKVRKQRIAIGATLEPGTKVRLVARELYSVSAGY